MTEGPQWISVQEATTLAKRGKTVIYGWVNRGLVRSRRGERGVLEVHGLDVMKAESAARPGRPRGSASLNATRRV